MKKIAFALFMMAALAACQPAGQAAPASGAKAALKVVAAETFLADIAQNVAGDRVKIDALMPIGVDPHGCEPTPTDVAKIADSSVLIVNGAGFEEFLAKLLQNAGGQRVVIEAAAGLTSRPPREGEIVDPALLPLPERFFAGGDYGPRGFPVDEVGPKFVGADGTVYPTGGNALLLGGAEMRYNLTRAFQVASFVDTGNVYPETGDLVVSDLRWSAGLGLRYRTPIGLIRVDWGYVLDPQPGDPGRSHFHLSIGHAF